jgi:hypothetical protein
MMNDSELKHIFMFLLDVVKALAWRPLYEEKRKRADYQNPDEPYRPARHGGDQR